MHSNCDDALGHAWCRLLLLLSGIDILPTLEVGAAIAGRSRCLLSRAYKKKAAAVRANSGVNVGDVEMTARNRTPMFLQQPPRCGSHDSRHLVSHDAAARHGLSERRLACFLHLHCLTNAAAPLQLPVTLRVVAATAASPLSAPASCSLSPSVVRLHISRQQHHQIKYA